MIKTFKQMVKRALKKCGYRLICLHLNQRITGFHFEDDIRFLVKSETPVCFDVGANEGQTIDRFKQAFRRPKIYAFEPSSDSYEKLQSKHYDNLVFLQNYALGRHNSQLEFNNYELSTLSSFLAIDKDPENPYRNVKLSQKEVVEVRTVDWFVKQHNLGKIDVLKIDTQGYDLKVLQGAAESLQQGLIDYVFIELNFVKMYDNQDEALQILTFLAGHNIYLVDYYEKIYRKNTLAWCNALFAKRQESPSRLGK